MVIRVDQIKSSFLQCSSELEVLGNWRRSLRTSGLQTSLALGSSELMSFPADFFLAMIFRTSNPWKLETFTQNFWSPDFFWRSVLQSLQVLNAGDVHPNFCLQALDQKHNLQRLGLVLQNFLSKVFRCFFGRSSEHTDVDDLLIRNKSSEALSIIFGLRLQLLIE